MQTLPLLSFLSFRVNGVNLHGISLPPLPADVSQVEAAKRIIEDRDPNDFLPPQKLAKRLYHLAFLEGDPDRPYALHHQMQSQAFYRMNIRRYDQLKVAPIHNEMTRAILAGKSIELRVPLGSYKPGSKVAISAADLERAGGLYDTQAAYDAYDSLVADFWRHYATLYTQRYRSRVFHKTEAMLMNKFDTFETSYTDLPEDKKKLLSFLSRKEAAKSYGLHFRWVHNAAMEHIAKAMMSKDDEEARRVSSFHASTSSVNDAKGEDVIFYEPDPSETPRAE